jgi:UDP-hydrolysing UDP-N-acetyl-D-glucosamine 2-epimerase
MQIPLVHLQGGEISGSIDDKIRDTNSKLADFHLTTNSSTRQNLISIGELPEKIKIVGCPSIDLLRERIYVNEPIHNKSSEFGGVGEDFSTSLPFGIILFHPDTFNSEDNEIWVNEILEVVQQTELNWFWFWPNPDYGSDRISKILRTSREKPKRQNVRFIRNLSPEKFMDLTIQAEIMIGNSSYGVREASFLGLPVINLGSRQLGRERGSNVLDILNPKNFFKELNLHSTKTFHRETIYGNGDSGILAARYLSDWQPKLKLRG